MIGRLLLVGLFFIGMINGQPQRLQTSLDALDEGLDWLNKQIEKNNREEAHRINKSATQDCFARTTTLYYCIDCLKQKFAAYADNPYAWGGQEEKLCKRAGYSERPF